MRNWPSSEERSETIAEECCTEMKKGQAIEAVGEAVKGGVCLGVFVLHFFTRDIFGRTCR